MNVCYLTMLDFFKKYSGHYVTIRNFKNFTSCDIETHHESKNLGLPIFKKVAPKGLTVINDYASVSRWSNVTRHMDSHSE